MIKLSKSALCGLALVAVLFPQVALASWWNPATWFNNWKFSRNDASKTITLENRILELESRLASSTTPEATSTLISPGNKEREIIKKDTQTADNAVMLEEKSRLRAEASRRAATEQEAMLSRQKLEEQARIDQQRAETEKLAAQKAANDAAQLVAQHEAQATAQRQIDQEAQLRRQLEEERQACMNSHYSRAQIQQKIDVAINEATAKTENDKNVIRSKYDSLIQTVNDYLADALIYMQETSRGNSSTLAIESRKQEAANDIARIQAQKVAAISSMDATLSASISRLQTLSVTLQASSQEAVCGV